MTEIYLIRHGQASFGEEDYDFLSALGVAQSERLGDWLRANNLLFDAVYSGERRRQRDTARIALDTGGFDSSALIISDAFNELDADGLLRHAIPRTIMREPSLAPLLMDIKANRDGFRRLFERIVDEWIKGDWQEAGIGTWEAFSQRVVQGVKGLAARHAEHSKIAVFTSGGPITATLRALRQQPGAGLEWGIANTSITRLSRDANGVLTLHEQHVLPHLAATPELVTHL